MTLKIMDSLIIHINIKLFQQKGYRILISYQRYEYLNRFSNLLKENLKKAYD